MDGRTVITIGREFGSGGHEIGMKLAERLGIKCYDKELLELAAKESGLCEELFASQDEKPTNSFLYSLVMDTYSLGYSNSYVDMPINHKVFLAQFDAQPFCRFCHIFFDMICQYRYRRSQEAKYPLSLF